MAGRGGWEEVIRCFCTPIGSQLEEKRRGKRTIIVRNESGIEREHLVPHGKYLRVHGGARVRAGDALVEGPLVPHDRVKYGNEELCNPAGRGLGPMSVQTGYKYVDGFLWFTNPGGSAGDGPGCGAGAPSTAKFWPQYAAGLVHDADFSVTGPHEHLLRDGPYVPYDAAVAPQRSHAQLAHYNRASADYNELP